MAPSKVPEMWLHNPLPRSTKPPFTKRTRASRAPPWHAAVCAPLSPSQLQAHCSCYSSIADFDLDDKGHLICMDESVAQTGAIGVHSNYQPPQEVGRQCCDFSQCWCIMSHVAACLLTALYRGLRQCRLSQRRSARARPALAVAPWWRRGRRGDALSPPPRPWGSLRPARRLPLPH